MHMVFVAFCFVVMISSVVMNAHDMFILMYNGCFSGIKAMIAGGSFCSAPQTWVKLTRPKPEQNANQVNVSWDALYSKLKKHFDNTS